MRHPALTALLLLVVCCCPSADREEFSPPPLPNPAWRSVADYGAVGDGVADDTAALQAALDDLHVVKQLYVPAGTYRITATLVARVVPDTYGNDFSRVVGADPATTVLRWDGAPDGTMVWIDSQPYSSWERLTLDGRRAAGGTAGEGFRCLWINNQPGSWMQFKDLVLRDLAYGIRAPRNENRMFAEVEIRRCRFLDIGQIGIEQASANHQNWFVWHSRFERCAVGCASDAYRELAVYDSTFIGSTVADLRGINAARGCWSKDSKTFYLGADHPIEPQIVLQGNTIIDTLDATAIDASIGGWWMTHFIDNTIRSRAGAAGPAIRSNARTLAIGNRLTVNDGIALGNANSTVLDTEVATRESIAAIEPARPGTPADRSRKVFSVFGANRDSGASGEQVQSAINDAVSWEAANPGSRPIVFLGNPMTLRQPLVIPPGTDIQLMGKSYVHTWDWQGPDSALIVVRGPTKVSLEHFELVAGPQRTAQKTQPMRSAIRLEGCDTPGSRLLLEDCQIANCFAFTDGTRRRGLEAHHVDHLRVEAQSWFSGSVRITEGGLDAQAGVYLFGSANVVSHPAYELVAGGRLVVQEAYSELFDDLGAGEQGMTLHCHGAGARSGEVVIDLYSNAASDAITRDGLVNLIAGWPGRVTQLTNSYPVGHTRIEGPAARTSLLTIASNWPRVDLPLPSGARVLQTNMDFAAMRQDVIDDAAFIREHLAFRRASAPLPRPLAAVPAGASDIRFHRLLVWGGTEDGIRIVGAGAAGTGRLPPPTFIPDGGSFDNQIAIAIAGSTGATIRYTTDGSTPTASSPVSSGPLTLTAATTVKAIAEQSGRPTSAVATATFTRTAALAPPTITPSGGAFDAQVTVGIEGPSGATIRYTTDGSTPDASSPVYTGTLTLIATTTVRAIATRSGNSDSPVASATFTTNTGATALLADRTPAQSDVTDGRPYELGMKFRVARAGIITAIRHWKAPSESGAHVGRLWSADGTLLASATFSGESASGWQHAALATPIVVDPGITYVVSVNANSHYVITLDGLASAITVGDLSTVADGANGVYGDAGVFPTQSWINSNYFRDVVFVPADGGNRSPVVTSPASADPTTVAGTTARLSVTASDPDGDVLGYAWRLTAQPTGSSPSFAAGSRTPTVTFDRAGSYAFAVTVGDGSAEIDGGSVTVDVKATPSDIRVTP